MREAIETRKEGKEEADLKKANKTLIKGMRMISLPVRFLIILAGILSLVLGLFALAAFFFFVMDAPLIIPGLDAKRTYFDFMSLIDHLIFILLADISLVAGINIFRLNNQARLFMINTSRALFIIVAVFLIVFVGFALFFNRGQALINLVLLCYFFAIPLGLNAAIWFLLTRRKVVEAFKGAGPD